LVINEIKNKMRIKLYCISILLFLMTVSTFAQEFVASVDRNPVPVGERFTVSFIINGGGSDFKGPDFKGFTVLGGPNQSQSVQIINGRTTRTFTLSYMLLADKTGTFTIGPASILSDGKMLKTQSLSINVLPESEAQKEQRKQEQEQEKTLNQQALDILKKNIYVKSSVSKRSVFIGEQITATYKLFIHPELNVMQLSPTKVPSLNGFWNQDLPIDKLQWKREVVNGVTFNTAVIKQVVLFPQRSGNLVVDPYEFNFTVRMRVQTSQRSRDFWSFFDDSFFSGNNFRDFEYKSSSEPLPIKVSEFTENRPPDFAGAVGDLKMEAFLDKTKTKTGQPVALKVKISGRGNLKLIQPLAINFPPGFEIYDPNISDNIYTTESGMSGSMTFEYLIIPKNAGNFKIEPVKFTYFDLNSKRFKTLQSDEFQIEVEKGDDNYGGAGITGVRKEEVQLIGKDIRYIKTKSSSLNRNKQSFFGSSDYVAMMLAPFLMFGIFFIIWRRKKHESYDLNLLRNRKATKIAKKRLSLAKSLINDKSNSDKFHEEINKALWGYLSDKLSIPNSELTKDKAKESLLEKGVSEELSSEFLQTLDNAEFARYSPSSNNHKLDEIYGSAVKAITQMEGELK